MTEGVGVPTSVLLAVLAAAGLLALAPALVRRYDATERLAAERDAVNGAGTRPQAPSTHCAPEPAGQPASRRGTGTAARGGVVATGQVDAGTGTGPATGRAGGATTATGTAEPGDLPPAPYPRRSGPTEHGGTHRRHHGQLRLLDRDSRSLG